MTKTKTRRHQIAFVVILLIVVLCSCVLVGSLLAWLKADDEVSSNGQLFLGESSFAIYNGNSQVSSGQEIAISGSTAIRTTDIKVRNTGTVDALIRATISIYYKDDSGNNVPFEIVSSPTSKGQATFSTLYWVFAMASGTTNEDINTGGGMTSGYMYYNSQIEPYVSNILVDNGDGTTSVVSQDVPANAVTIVSQVLLSSEQVNETIYIKVAIDGIAYSGNIYKKVDSGLLDADSIPVEAYPFGTPDSLPDAWTAPYL